MVLPWLCRSAGHQWRDLPLGYCAEDRSISKYSPSGLIVLSTLGSPSARRLASTLHSKHSAALSAIASLCLLLCRQATRKDRCTNPAPETLATGHRRTAIGQRPISGRGTKRCFFGSRALRLRVAISRKANSALARRSSRLHARTFVAPCSCGFPVTAYLRREFRHRFPVARQHTRCLGAHNHPMRKSICGGTTLFRGVTRNRALRQSSLKYPPDWLFTSTWSALAFKNPPALR